MSSLGSFLWCILRGFLLMFQNVFAGKHHYSQNHIRNSNFNKKTLKKHFCQENHAPSIQFSKPPGPHHVFLSSKCKCLLSGRCFIFTNIERKNNVMTFLNAFLMTIMLNTLAETNQLKGTEDKHRHRSLTLYNTPRLCCYHEHFRGI